MSDMSLASSPAAPDAEIEALTPGQILRQRMLNHTGFLIGAGLIGAIVLIAIFAPVLAPHDPFAQELSARMLPPAWAEGGRTEYLLGTDQNGRDYLSRLIYGTRVSITIGSSGLLTQNTFGHDAARFSR